MFKKTEGGEYLIGDVGFNLTTNLWYFAKLTSLSSVSFIPLFNDIPMVPKNLDCLKGCFNKYDKTSNPKHLKKVQKQCSEHGLDRQVPTHIVEGVAHAQLNFSDVRYIFSLGVTDTFTFTDTFTCPFFLTLNPNLDCLVDYERRERTGCRNTNDGVCNFIGQPNGTFLQVDIDSIGFYGLIFPGGDPSEELDYYLRATSPAVKAIAICALAKMIQALEFLNPPNPSWPEFVSPPTCDHFIPNIFDDDLCSCVGTCAPKIDFDPTTDKDPNLIFHFHTDKGLWDCQKTCNRTTGCEFYTHSRVNYFEEQNKFVDNRVSPVFHCFLWRTCDKFFIPQQGKWLDLRSGPRDCAVYNQNCPIVFDKNGALPSANLPTGYTQMPCPDTLPPCTCYSILGGFNGPSNCTQTSWCFEVK